MEITGSGKVIFSSKIGAFSSHRVSPVLVSLSPRVAAIPPAKTSSISILSLECIRKSRPILSFVLLVGLST